MTTLADFGIKPVTVKIKTAYGRELEVTLAPPSYHRYRELMAAIPEPTPPMKINAERKSVPDREHSGYIAAMQKRAIDLNYYVVVDALVRGGLELPGSTLAEQAEAFRASEPDSGIVNALIAFVIEAAIGVRATPDSAQFRPVSTAGNASMSGDGDNA